MPANEALDLRARILGQATQLFVAAGYNGISMREIAEAVGVSKAGLYYHFKDKEDLFLAILTDNLNSIEQIVQAARHAGATSREQIGALVRALFAQPADQRAIIRLAGQELAHLAPDTRADFNRRYHEQFIGQVAGLLHDAIARGELRPSDPYTLTWLLLGMMYPFFTASPDREQRAHDQAIEQLLALFFDGAAIQE